MMDSSGSSDTSPIPGPSRKARIVPLRSSPSSSNGSAPPVARGRQLLDEDEDLFSQESGPEAQAPDEPLSDLTNKQDTPGISNEERDRKEKERRRSRRFSTLGSSTPGKSSSDSGLSNGNQAVLTQIYAGCMEMFHNKKITADNAFSLKLLECLDQIIRTKTLDTSNMQMVGSTLEGCAKIFSCRVENTYDFVVALAKTLGISGKGIEKLKEVAQELDAAEGEAMDTTGAQGGQRQRQKQRKKKRMLHTQPLEKLRMTFPDYTESYENRQDQVKAVFTKFLADREYFDMNELTLNGGDVGEAEKFIPVLDRPDPIPNDPIRLNKTILTRDATHLKFVRFFQFKDDSGYDKDVYDLWGRPMQGEGSAEEEKRAQLEQMRLRREAQQNIRETSISSVGDGGFGGGDNEYAFDPNIPVELPASGNGEPREDDGIDDYYQDMADLATQGSEAPGSGRGGQGTLNGFTAGGMMEVSNIHELKRYCEALQELQTARLQSNAYFLNTIRRGINRTGAPTTRTQRPKKTHVPIKFDDINWRADYARWKETEESRVKLTEKEKQKQMGTKISARVRYALREEEACAEEEEFMEAVADAIIEDPEPPDSQAHTESQTETSAKPKAKEEKGRVDPFLEFFIAPYNILQLLRATGAAARLNGDMDGSSGAMDHLDASLHLDMVEGGLAEGNYNVEDLWEDGLEDIRQEDADYCPIRDRGEEGEELGAGPTPSNGMDSFMTFFPYTQPEEGVGDEYNEFVGESADSNGVKFARQPKPINMKKLKDIIKRFLAQKLCLDPETFAPTLDAETSVEFLPLVKHVYGTVEERTQKYLSFSIILAALLHVIVDLRLFAKNEPGEPETLKVVCHGKLWSHKDNIPMPGDEEEEDDDARPSTSAAALARAPIPTPMVIPEEDEEGEGEEDQPEPEPMVTQ